MLFCSYFSSKSYNESDDIRYTLYRDVKAAFLMGARRLFARICMLKVLDNADKNPDRRLKHKFIMAVLTFLHVIMVINQLNAKFAAAFPMRSRIFDAFRRIWK